MIYFTILTLSIVVGLIGRKRKFGFWGYFFASLLLTPIMGFILVVASDRRKPNPIETRES